MTIYYQTLSLQYLSTNPTPTTLNISSSDTIELGVDTSSYADGNGWFRYGTPVGCTTSATAGADGEAVVITPNVGATSYSVTFRTLIAETSTYYYGRIAGTISTGGTTPTYSVANASTNEGASATVNVTTTNVANATTLYWTVDATTADVSTTSGSFTISSNAGSFTIPAIADSLTEGTETYTISIRTGSTAGTVVATSTLTINDTSTTPAAATYAINFYDTAYAAKTTFNEGEQALVFITTTNVSDGTTLYWSTSSGSDLVAPVNGSFVVSYGFVSATLTIAADSLTEGTESLTFYLRSGSVSGTVLSSSSITINDTSVAVVTPTYSVANASTNEGASATVNVTTTNVANATTLYWTVNATTADVSTTSGSFTITSNVGSFTIPAIADSTTEGTETYTISIRTGSTAGTVVATSTLTINDTSTTVVSDTTPNAFSFTNQTGVPLSTVTSSNIITISGINTATSISVSAGSSYSINETGYTSTPGTITNGQTVSVRHTSSPSTSANTTTTLTIGGVQGTFTSTTTSVIPAVYGLRIYDEFGNITLDTTDETMKDLGTFSIASVTANQSILGVPLTTNSIALVNNNNGDTDTSIASAVVSLNISTSSITVSGGSSGFNISIRMMEF